MRGPASRRRLLTFALAGLCAALAVLAFLPPPDPVPAVRAGAGATAPAERGTTEIAIPLRAEGGPAFKRPIFLASRRMPGGGSGEPVDGLKLKAVFLGPGMKKALVETTGGNAAVWVTPGQNFRGWRVEEIHAESVVLTGRSGRRTLELEKPEAAPAARSRRKPARPVRNPVDPERVQITDGPE